MERIRQFIDIFIHLDKHLNEWAGSMGGGLYALLALIIFCETGLVITPFLPGDSLLFIAGSLSANGSLSLNLLLILLIFASILGNKLNYFIGKKVGPHIFYHKQ